MLEQLKAAGRKVYEKLPRPGSSFAKISGPIAAAIIAILASEKDANADAVPFDDEINNIVRDSPWGPVSPAAGHAQLMPDARNDRLRITFSANQENQTICRHCGDIFGTSFEIDDDDENGIIIRRIASVETVPGLDNPERYEATCLEVERPDGGTIRRFAMGSATPDNDLIVEDGEPRGFGGRIDCAHGGAFSIHPSSSRASIKIAALMPVPGWSPDSDIWTADINAPDFCTNIQNAIAAAAARGENPYEAGLLDIIESHPDFDDIKAPEDIIGRRLHAVTREDLRDRSRHTHLLARNPDTGMLEYLQRNPDGSWTVESPQRATPDPVGTAWAMLQRTTPRGRRVTLFADGVSRAEDSAGILRVIALQEQVDGSYQELPITMEVNEAAVIDTDGDGREDADDGCRLRANAGGVDTAGPEGTETPDGREDACQAQCSEGGWPGVDPAGETNASGLRLCASELGYSHAFTDEDGSTLHSDMDVALDVGGNIALQSGQEVRYIHSRDPRTAARPARNIIFPDGNSAHIQTHDMRELDGSLGRGILAYTPYSDPFGTPVTVEFVGPRTWNSDEAVIDAQLGLEGCDTTVRAGTENLPTTCPPICEPTEDAGSDAGPDDPDAGVPDDDAETPEGDAETPDAGVPDLGSDAEIPSDAGVDSDSAAESDMKTIHPADAGLPGSDTGSDPIKPDLGETDNPSPGCGCDIAAKPNQDRRPARNIPEIVFLLGSAAAFAARPLRKRRRAERTAESKVV